MYSCKSQVKSEEVKKSVLHSEIYNLFTQLEQCTYKHSIRVYMIALEYDALHYNDYYLSYAGLLHDIGKIWITDRIISKPGPLSKLEREIIDLHCYFGLKTLRENDILSDIIDIVYFHHGQNPSYIIEPRCFASDEVLEKAAVLHTIDVFEALTADRPYRESISIKEALDIIDQDENKSIAAYEFLRERYFLEEDAEYKFSLLDGYLGVDIKRIIDSVPQENYVLSNIRKIV